MDTDTDTGDTIHNGREILCLPYARFFLIVLYISGPNCSLSAAYLLASSRDGGEAREVLGGAEAGEARAV